jgi:hypothetical protein
MANGGMSACVTSNIDYKQGYAMSFLFPVAAGKGNWKDEVGWTNLERRIKSIRFFEYHGHKRLLDIKYE